MMQTKGFLASLFDYSFSAFITPRIVRVLYMLVTLVMALSTIGDIALAFKLSSALGVFALIFSPLVFVVGMIFARVALEVAIVFFRIHEDVREINEVAGNRPVAASAGPRPEAGPAVAPA